MRLWPIALCVGLACALGACHSEPRDAALIENFRQHRAEFETLRSMIMHDQGLHRVDDDWTDPADPASIGIPSERIAQYRSIFKKLRIRRGFQSFSGSEQLNLLAHCEGIVVSGSSKGYTWLPFPPLKPVSSLDEFRDRKSEEYGKYLDHRPNSWEKHGEAHRLLEGHWYLYYSS